MGLNTNNSMRQGCWSNVISKSALSAMNGVGTVYFVDSVNGVDTGRDGKSWGNALKTIAKAVTLVSAGDTIMMKGSFSEAVTCSTASIHFMGAGGTPKDCIWTAPTVAASFCLSPAANYITVENIYFKPVIYTTSGVPSALRLSGSNWLTVKNCRFQGQTGSYTAIYSPVCDSDNVHIINCEFFYMNTATNGCAILGVEAGGLSYSGWLIDHCHFMSNLKHIDVNMRAGVIRDSIFPVGGIDASATVQAALTTMCIDLSGTSSGANVVGPGNVFGGEYDTDIYKPGAAADCWVGNYTLIEATDAPYGLTVVEPAAED